MALWLGLDFGTSAAKALLVSDEGTVRGRAAAAYSTVVGPGGIAEQDPKSYLAAIRELVAACCGEERPDAVGIVGHSPSQVLVNERGDAVRPALTWQDVRARGEARELGTRLGHPVPILGTSIPWAAMYPAPKLRWLARHDPHLVSATRWVLSPKDFAGFWLTGSPISDPWSSRGLCNVATGAVAEDALVAAGWSPSVVPELAPAWVARGTVTRAAARASRLPAGIPVSVGWSDALGAVLAVGGFERAAAFVISGTADVIGISAPTVPRDASPLFSVPAACAPLPLVYGATQSSGAAVAWALRTLKVEAANAAARAAAPDRPSGRAAAPESDTGRRADEPAFVPYLSGERAPIWRDDVRAAFFGLVHQHSAADLVRAVELGVSCSGRDVLDMAEAIVGGRADHVLLGGASAADRGAVDLRLSTLGRRVTVMREPQASALGAAMLAASAAGVPLETAVRVLRGPSEEIDPTDEQLRAGEEALTRYRRARALALAWADAALPRN